jgi:hypothetical protein
MRHGQRGFAGELSYLSSYKTVLFRLHGMHLGVATVLILLNLCGVYYWIACAQLVVLAITRWPAV